METLWSLLKEGVGGETAKLRESLNAKFKDCRDSCLNRIFAQLRKQVYRLQGAGYECALVGCRPVQRTTVKFDVFEDDNFKKGFFEDNRPIEYQEAIFKVFCHSTFLN